MSIAAAAIDKRRPRRRFWRWPSDGTIMQLVFYALLGGAAVTLWLDLDSLRASQPYQPGVNAPAILPAIDRPGGDPAIPAILPGERIRADNGALTAPLRISLKPDGVLLLEGTINRGAADRFGAEIAERGEYVRVVRLNSPGGSVEDALAISNMLRAGEFATEVADGGFCASSCPLVFAGGTERLAGTEAVIGVHQVFASGDTLPGPARAMSDAQTTTARIARHLDGMGIDAEVWVHALETPPDRLYYFTADELVELGLATEIVS